MSISSVTSEALQLKLRQLLPSQQGFGTDLSASDTIIPIVDLTASAEGSDVRPDLQNAIAFGSQTAFSANNNTDVIANSPGFYRIFGVSNVTVNGFSKECNISMSDGLSTKLIFQHVLGFGSVSTSSSLQFDFIVFLDTGESISCTSDNTLCFIGGSSRQIADINGALVQPSGFTPQ